MSYNVRVCMKSVILVAYLGVSEVTGVGSGDDRNHSRPAEIIILKTSKGGLTMPIIW